MPGPLTPDGFEDFEAIGKSPFVGNTQAETAEELYGTLERTSVQIIKDPICIMRQGFCVFDYLIILCYYKKRDTNNKTMCRSVSNTGGPGELLAETKGSVD